MQSRQRYLICAIIVFFLGQCEPRIHYRVRGATERADAGARICGFAGPEGCGPDRCLYRALAYLRQSDARPIREKLTDDIFELRVKEFDRIFRVLFFYQPGMLIVITSGFQKKTRETPPGEIARAEHLRKLWMRFRNHYPVSTKDREAILKESGL